MCMGSQPDPDALQRIDAQIEAHLRISREFLRDDRGPEETQAVVEAAQDYISALARERADILADAE